MQRPADLSSRGVLAAVFIAVVGACGGYNTGEVVENTVYNERDVETLPIAPPTIEAQKSGTEALLQAVSPVSDDVVWVSGHQGTYSRSTNGGSTWETAVVPGADTLQFRDVHAASASEAWLLSAGPGELSNVYHTSDAGVTWTLQWTNGEPDGFYDCLDFWDAERGALYGDAVDGVLRIMRTEDGGQSWTRVPDEALPPANDGEGGFAASGTCLVTGAEGRGWISSGNADPSRVLMTSDYGRSWQAHSQPIPGGSGGGLFSVSFRDEQNGIVFGGSLNPETEPGPRVAVSHDGGMSWTVAGEPHIGGAIFGGAWVPGTDVPLVVVVAPSGADYSLDGGHSWLPLDPNAYWGIGFSSRNAGWLVGPGGRITKVRF